jgi:arylsulfatase A-like enzyme
MSSTRREWLAGMPAAAVAAQAQQNAAGAAKPNIVLIISDQFRWDCVGAMGVNPMNLTPNLDRMAGSGVMFRNAFCNQPVCAPARASMFTGQYPVKHGVWKNGLALPEGATTLAKSLHSAGYSANYLGKWHLGNADTVPLPERNGPVPLERRGGFVDLWEGANTLELTSHAYEGTMWDRDNKPFQFSGKYRSDVTTERAQSFLKSAKSPFFLTLSYLEVHHQNDRDSFDPPNEYKGKYPNPFIPGDLRPLPGTWPSQWSDYLACVNKMDETVGTIRKTLEETGLAQNTILMFVSDHACHFKTRNSEYKRTPHESSIHVPLIVEGPGFRGGKTVERLVSQVDLMPSLLEAAGLPIPSSVQGRSFLPLANGGSQNWRDEVYFEMTEFTTGRGLRTPQYTYAVAAPKVPGWKVVQGAEKYVEYMLYDNYADPYQHVNLAGRTPYQPVLTDLRRRLLARMKEAGDPAATIEPAWFPYP